ncbi:MAG: MBL fold metallo-hydrolase [Desulfobacterales bacterium]|nr:MBL fold metallo-hydrolase [Desulfobacterales bacterium]
MSNIIRIKILIENTAHGHHILAEHGISFWIDTGAHHLLFDTGQGLPNVLSGNAKRLQARLDQTDAIALSHGHYDHTGGLEYALAAADNPKIYVHPSALHPKYIREGQGTSRDIGMPNLDEEKIRRQVKKLVWTEQPTQIFENIFLTGQIPRDTEFEDTGGSFFLDKKLRYPDPLLDDQALFFESSQGTVVLMGCAHAGVINTLRYIKQLTEGVPIYAVIGGMHLESASPERMSRTINALRQLKVERLAPAHCTGLPATVDLWSAFPGRCLPCQVGTSFTFEVG